MLKQYLKQALNMLRENPLISVISILGTALSIAMIMIVILDFQVQLTSFVPEVNRDRMLYVEQGTEVKTNNSWSRGNMSVEAVRECFYSLKTPEAVSAWFTIPYPLSLPGKQMFNTYHIFYTDPGFWKVYAFSFLEGKPFTEADFRHSPGCCLRERGEDAVWHDPGRWKAGHHRPPAFYDLRGGERCQPRRRLILRTSLDTLYDQSDGTQYVLHREHVGCFQHLPAGS